MRRSPETALPPDWKPSATARAPNGVDLAYEAEFDAALRRALDLAPLGTDAIFGGQGAVIDLAAGLGDAAARARVAGLRQATEDHALVRRELADRLSRSSAVTGARADLDAALAQQARLEADRRQATEALAAALAHRLSLAAAHAHRRTARAASPHGLPGGRLAGGRSLHTAGV